MNCRSHTPRPIDPRYSVSKSNSVQTAGYAGLHRILQLLSDRLLRLTLLQNITVTYSIPQLLLRIASVTISVMFLNFKMTADISGACR